MQTDTFNTSRILRLPDVKAKTGLSRSSIYDGVKKGTFPHYISLGSRAVGWLECEINQWISTRIEISRNKQAGQHNA